MFNDYSNYKDHFKSKSYVYNCIIKYTERYTWNVSNTGRVIEQKIYRSLVQLNYLNSW